MQSRTNKRMTPLLFKIGFGTFGFENVVKNKEVRRKENAVKDKQKKTLKNTKVLNRLCME